ncbi:MAG: DedA family protein [Microgenomates group bacterium]
MEFAKIVFDFILHIDVHLGQIILDYGMLTYAILFGIIFVETGLVFVPFLPGDSLLFAAGAFAALGSLNLWITLGLMVIAAILGDTVNYWIGHFFGQKLVDNPKVPINKEHIEETQKFFDKHGGKTIILARFVPIVRTFAPFVAGIGKMHYVQFLSYNVIGGTAWVLIATFAGFFFGNIPFVKENFSLVVLGIVMVSIVPMLVPLVKNWIKK